MSRIAFAYLSAKCNLVTSFSCRTTGLTSFPDYLVLHMRKFVMEDGWVPKKLDVYIDVPDIIDISHMRSSGLQSGEELLPESAGDGQAESTKLLLSMGFGQIPCEKAAINTGNAGVEEAMNWMLSHMDDPDINDPISHDSQKAALLLTNQKVEILKKQLTGFLSNPDALSASDMDASSSSAVAADAELPDGFWEIPACWIW
ncbi:Ubiquitin carboxyl-terminal hydrolase 14 [Bienertia sinuspersici]